MQPTPATPTLKDIAERAGVSRNTVSCALRNDRRISEATRARIREIADEIGYRPNPLRVAHMRGLRESRPAAAHVNLGFVHWFESEEAWRDHAHSRALLIGATDRATRLGYNLVTAWAGEPGMTGPRLTKILRSRGVVGTVFAWSPDPSPLPGFDWDSLASATMGFSITAPHLHRCATFFHHSIPVAWRELRNLGYERIGVDLSIRDGRQRDQAWEAGLAILLAEPRKCRPVVRRDELPNQLSTADWVKKQRLDAIIVAGPRGRRQTLTQAGLRVPGDLGYVSLVGPTESATVQADWTQIGSASIDLVDEQLMRNERGIPSKPKTVLIDGAWTPGNSVRVREVQGIRSTMPTDGEDRRS
jgi:LacI family transcriptional regulator